MAYFYNQPVIIIGMHRSGTSMLSRHLSMLGVNMGARQEKNWESHHIRRINQLVFRQINAAWNHVTPFNNLYASRDHMQAIEDLMLSFITTRFYLSHLGILDGISAILNINSIKPWGWKDPRNTFTLPMWKSIFPNARIIHIFRNPIDVALSLKTREQTVGAFIKNDIKSRIKRTIRHGRLGLSNVDMLDPECGIQLWEQYVSQADVYKNHYPDTILNICYEDYLTDPERSIKNVAEFLELDVLEKDQHRVIASIKSGSRYKFINSDEGINIYRSCKNNSIFKKLGYPLRLKHVI